MFLKPLPLLVCPSLIAGSPLNDDTPLRLPAIGDYQLRVLGPAVLEMTLITAKPSGLGHGEGWDFIGRNQQCSLPPANAFLVLVAGQTNAVQTVGFKRRVLYAPLKQRDLRVANYLYLQLTAPIKEGDVVEVRNPDKKVWRETLQFKTKAETMRWSPVIHVNQTGYLPAHSKKAIVGYYLGSLGEMNVHASTFRIIAAKSDQEVFAGKLAPRMDQGFPLPCYQHVLEADFTSVKTPGEYRVLVPGLGASFPFFINDGVAAAFARTHALGIYHQRCGTDNVFPFTRFTHKPCHTAPAVVPDATSKFASANASLAKETANYKDNPRHTAPQLKNVAASLYPFVNTGPVDVRGGHHDAGDYSKYTINSAAFIHHLVFAADAFPGVKDLDNLGLPESGDGKSDVLQEAKWEADFLAKMQDADGGFYFLVYPRDREYEDNVTPDNGDPQVVFPKTTSATAAAVAALAQCASSPAFKKQFPEAAALYLEKAINGWNFLQRAIQKYGQDGAYQKITHYGDEFMHDDELAWAACELFLATGDSAYHKEVMERLKPADPQTRRWGWWRLFDSYGCAIRSYAFGAKSGRVKREALNPLLLTDCENEIAACGEDQLRRAERSAYGTSFPLETKRVLTAGWYFSSDAAFDLAVACQLDYPVKRDPRPKMLEALWSNLDYEQGCNPVNVCYLTGLGWKRQREIVDQYAQNDQRILPPSGIPLGNIQAGFGWNYQYNQELDQLSFPPDSDPVAPYPFYDRWGDGFNLSQEFVIVNQARALGYLAWLMAQTPLKSQPWRAAAAQITRFQPSPSAPSRGSAVLSATGLDLSSARIVWEANDQEPFLGEALPTAQKRGNPQWIEAEAQLPDGRRAFARWDATRPKDTSRNEGAGN
jgi:hypothetical protein